MRKFVCSFMVLTMMTFFLTGCADGQTTDKADAKEPAIVETKEPVIVEVSEPDAAGAAKTDVYVFIAARLKNSMEEIQAMYGKVNPDVNLIFNADSAGILKTQIEEGAECDLFFSAAMKQMDELDAGGYVESGTIRKLLENEVVLIKPAGLDTAVAGFENITDAENIALAGEEVPVGAYAREIFTSLGILDEVMGMEINQGSNVTAVLAAVSEQSNEVGVVYVTDAESAAGQVEIIASAPEGTMKNPPVYPIGQIVNGDAPEEEKAAAEEFLEYLSTDEALQVFKEYGFIVYEE